MRTAWIAETFDRDSASTAATAASGCFCDELSSFSTVAIWEGTDIWQQLRPALRVRGPQCIAMVCEHPAAGVGARHGIRQARTGVTAQNRTAATAAVTRIRLTATSVDSLGTPGKLR